MFGSSGLISQPRSGVIENFIYRMDWYSSFNQYVKSIVRTSAAGALHHHQSRISSSYLVAKPKFKVQSTAAAKSKPGEDFAIHLNHYPIQSYEWFMRVKASRGDAAHAHSDNVRDERYFLAYDTNTSVFDDELRRKTRSSASIVSLSACQLGF